MQDVEKDGQAGRVVTTYDAQNRPKTMVESGGKMYPYDSTWKSRDISKSAAKVDYQLTSDLYKKHSGNVIDMLKDYETIRGPLSPEGRNEFFQKYGYSSTLPAANAAPATAVTGTTPAVPDTGAAGTGKVSGTPTGNAASSGGRANSGRAGGGGASVSSPGGGVSTPIGTLQTNQALGKKAGEEKIETGAIVEREKLKPGAKAEGDQVAIDIKNQAFADRSYDLFKPINDAVLKSTGSSIGAGVDKLGGVIGKSTEGSKAIARLNVLSYNILANIPRFEGPQSDIDVQMYKQAAGALNDKTLPIEDRLAALDALRTILQRYDKAGRNDWTFGAGGSQGDNNQTPAQKAAAEIERRKKERK
jgi:hypothetical protein